MPDLRADARLRLARAGAVAAVAGALGVAAHASAGGLLPHAGWLVAALVVLTVAGAVVLGSPATRTTLVALVAGGQLLVHLLLTALAGHGGEHTGRGGAVRRAALAPTDAEDRRGPLQDLAAAPASAPAAAPAGGGEAALPHWTQHLVEDLSGPHAVMALAHLLAAAGIGLWLALGEHALWALVCLVGAGVAVVVLLVARLLVRLLAPRPVARTARVRRTGRRPHRALLPAPLLGATALRGPPCPTYA